MAQIIVKLDDILTDWLKDALIFVLLWSLHATVNELADALTYFTETVNSDGPIALSLASLFELLGFQLNSTEVTAILDRNMDDLLSSQAAP
jgi:hypothetical protein